MAEVRSAYVKARTSIRPFWMRVWWLGSGVLAGLRTMLPSANRKVLPGHGQVTQPSLIVPCCSGPPM